MAAAKSRNLTKFKRKILKFKIQRLPFAARLYNSNIYFKLFPTLKEKNYKKNVINIYSKLNIINHKLQLTYYFNTYLYIYIYKKNKI